MRPRGNRGSIDQYMTIAHGANFRLELWFALGKKYSRHQTYPSWLKVRAKNFVEFLNLVTLDRTENLAEAVKTRKEQRAENADGNDDNEDSNDESVDGVDIDPTLLS